MKNNKIYEHSADICVIGGGFAGICAAIAAARHGSKVILIHDRPMFGGNASSEIRMCPGGAHGPNRRETGIYEEIILNNLHRNPTRRYGIWDNVLFEAVKTQENLTSFLNCSVHDADTENNVIKAVYAWQLTTYKQFKFTADIFIDCSGDSILAELTGAEYRHGREARSEFNEEAAPIEADSKTMGNSCLIQTREFTYKVPYTPPKYARVLDTEENMETRDHRCDFPRTGNFWWMELGGMQNTIDDAEEIRDELIKLSFGVWDHIKNHGDHGADNWDLEFAGFLPGKRESRRYIGAHILNQNEVQAGGNFEDIIAYGGWKIDDHPPGGFDHKGEPTRYFKCPSPFGIPYGCICSKNIDNLMFAGRNISATHAAMAASRVMATCALLGQAAGTAAALAKEKSILPRDISGHIEELQDTLMNDDCWLPGLKRKISDLCKSAKLTADCNEDKDNLRNGNDRPLDNSGDNGVYVPLDSDISYELQEKAYVESVRIIFDSDLNRTSIKGGIPEVRKDPTICNVPLMFTPFTFPSTMVKSFDIICDGEVIYSTDENYLRFVTIPVNKEVNKITLRPRDTYGDEMAHVFSFDFK